MLRNYFAGFEDAAMKLDEDQMLLDVLPYRLLAYNVMADGKLDDFYLRIHRHRFKEIILDSGAYWAWRNNGEINRENYIDYCLGHKDRIDNFVVLDRIPGSYAPKGQRVHIPVNAYVATAEATYENYRFMVKRMGEAGVSPDRIIHVFHMREPFSFLRQMVADKVPYVGLSVSNARDVTKSERHQWLKDCMEVLRNEDGSLKNGVKLHAFGISSSKWLSEFPWHSADASSWGIQARNSCILMPPLRNPSRESYNGVPFESKWNFRKPPTAVDLGHIAASNDFWLNKRLGGDRQRRANYRMTVLHYVYDLGLNMGESTLRRRDSAVYRSDLFPGEHFLSKKLSDTRETNMSGSENSNVQWTEQKISEGLQHSIVFRMWVNALTTNLFIAQLNGQKGSTQPVYPGTQNNILMEKGNGHEK